MKIKIMYRKGAKPVWLFIDGNNKTISEIAEQGAKILREHYESYMRKRGYNLTGIQYKQYELGQKVLLKLKLREKYGY